MQHVNSVAVNLIVNTGSRYEENFEEGMSHFLEHMAFKGTTTRSAKQIAEEFDSIGGQFNAYTGHEQTVYYTKTLNEHFDKALEILVDILQNSVFSQSKIDKEYHVILQEIAHTKDNPDDLIYEKFFASTYHTQPLGKLILGTAETLKNFDKTHFNDYIKKHFNAGNLYLSVAGNISHEQVVKSAQKFFYSLNTNLNSGFTKATYT